MGRGAVDIGGWQFDPAAGELARGAERRRLEDRAARTLDLLARRRGEVVTQAEIVAEVWDGRHQSANSLAVVISDLRRALDDDARDPRHIETVTKRGYRLRGEPGQPEAGVQGGRFRPWMGLTLAAAALAAAAAAGIAWRSGQPQPPAVRIEAVANVTGEPRYAPLTKSVAGLIVTDLQARGGTTLLADGSGRHADVVVSSQLILWTGYPAVSFSAVDPSKGVTFWSDMAPGPEAALPGQVAQAMAGLDQAIARRYPRARR